MLELVGADKVAERYGVTVATVYTWTRRGIIPCVRPSRRVVLYSLETVERAITRPLQRAATVTA